VGGHRKKKKLRKSWGGPTGEGHNFVESSLEKKRRNKRGQEGSSRERDVFAKPGRTLKSLGEARNGGE